MKITLLVLVFTLLFSLTTISAKDSPHNHQLISPDEIEATIDQLSLVLQKKYVYPETAKAMREFLSKRLATGEYQTITTRGSLIEKLQADMRQISNDGHLSLRLAEDAPDRSNHILPIEHPQGDIQIAVVSKEGAARKIGYLRLNTFSGDPRIREHIIAAISGLAEFDSLIIDLRENGGGDPDLIALLSSYFLEDDTHLWSIIDRNGDSIADFYSASNEEKFTGDLCILTSNKTYSAAEAFAYTLKHAGRARIVGEITGGGAHLVEMQQVNNDIDIRLPVARAYNRVTKSNWEGTGVIPTISVNASIAKSTAIQLLSK